MNLVPARALRRRARRLRAGTSPSGNPAVGRAATTLLVAGALAHTFVIGMQTMEVGHVPVAGADVGDLDVRVAAGARRISTSR